MRIGRQKAERHRIERRALNLTAGKDARRITINQQRQQYRRMVRCRASPSLTARKPTQVQLINDFSDKTSQMVFRLPLINRWRLTWMKRLIKRKHVANCLEYVAILPKISNI
jgi:hypothetical protein